MCAVGKLRERTPSHRRIMLNMASFIFSLNLNKQFWKLTMLVTNSFLFHSYTVIDPLYWSLNCHLSYHRYWLKLNSYQWAMYILVQHPFVKNNAFTMHLLFNKDMYLKCCLRKKYHNCGYTFQNTSEERHCINMQCKHFWHILIIFMIHFLPEFCLHK